ncbi:OmpA family protein [Vibrio mediterranei]
MKFGYILIALLSCSALANETRSIKQYTSDDYLMNQYAMIKGVFKDLEVTKSNKREIRVVIPNSYGFETGKYSIRRPMKEKLKDLSLFLNSYPESVIEIYGHTDNVGSAESNIILGMNRANAVGQQLRVNKVSHTRITVISEGEEVPRCSNATSKGKECNRRVEMVIALERHLSWHD